NTLLLTTRQLRTLVSNTRVVAVRQRHDKVVDIGGPGCCNDLLMIYGLAIGDTILDVFADRDVKQDGLLANKRHVLADVAQLQIAHVILVNGCLAVLSVVPTFQERNNGRLAASRGSNQSYSLRRLHLDIDTLEDLVIGASG